MDPMSLTLNHIDFKWVEETEDPKLLKKAIKLLKDDGGFFVDLQKAIEDKLEKVDKKFRVLNQTKNERISPDEIKKQTNDILNWEKDIIKSDKILSGKTENSPDGNVGGKTASGVNHQLLREQEIERISKKKQAENEKIKGNESMTVKEYDEAIRFYNNSLKLDPLEPTTYCNRSLAFIKQKQFEKGLGDCNKAIELKYDYAKAYYRRAMCCIGMSKFRDAFEDFLTILKTSPNSPEMLEELKNLKEKWNTHVGKEQWKKMENEVEKEIEMVRAGKDFTRKVKKENVPPQTQTQAENQNPNVTDTKKSGAGFKKIKIVEEEVEEIPESQKTTRNPHNISTNSNIKVTNSEDEIDSELKSKYENFMQAGESVKKELQKLMDISEFKKAEGLAREALKNCQNFINLFKINSKYHLEIEKAIEEINKKIAEIESKSVDSSKDNGENSVSNNKYYKTKILSEEVRENATKLAESDMNFDDFPKTSYGFEKAYNSMKKRPDVFFNYLKYLGAKTLTTFYQTTEITYQTLIGILQTLNKHSFDSKQNAELTIDYLQNISKTKNFFLIKKFLKKTDKEDLKQLFNGLRLNFPDLVDKIDLEKLYF